MKRSGFDEIETLFDSFDARIKTVHTAVYAGESLFEMRNAHLQILDFIDHAIQFLFHPRKARLDLLEYRKNDIRSFGHAEIIDVPDMFFKRERVG